MTNPSMPPRFAFCIVALVFPGISVLAVAPATYRLSLDGIQCQNKSAVICGSSQISAPYNSGTGWIYLHHYTILSSADSSVKTATANGKVSRKCLSSNINIVGCRRGSLHFLSHLRSYETVNCHHGWWTVVDLLY